jgi:uncharacterized membrane protein YfcA
MHFDAILIIELMLLGAMGGFLAGLLGIGGGMVLVPFLTHIFIQRGLETNLAVKMAIATGMATIVFTSLSSMRSHHKKGAVRWDIARSIAPGILVGAALASVGVFSLVKGTYLAIFFGLFVSFSAYQMLRDKKPKPSRQIPGPIGLVGAGSAIGFLSGLVGAGGGFLTVPFLVWCNTAMHQAVATSAALGFPIALANTLGFIWVGHSHYAVPSYSLGLVYAPALLCLASVSVLFAPLGARVSHSLPVHKLKRIFALVLFALAAYMLWRGVAN